LALDIDNKQFEELFQRLKKIIARRLAKARYANLAAYFSFEDIEHNIWLEMLKRKSKYITQQGKPKPYFYKLIDSKIQAALSKSLKLVEVFPPPNPSLADPRQNPERSLCLADLRKQLKNMLTRSKVSQLTTNRFICFIFEVRTLKDVGDLENISRAAIFENIKRQIRIRPDILKKIEKIFM